MSNEELYDLVVKLEQRINALSRIYYSITDILEGEEYEEDIREFIHNDNEAEILINRLKTDIDFKRYDKEVRENQK